MSNLSNELRWNPLLGCWIIVSSGRAGRPWRSGGCPFCPGAPETGYGWDVLVLGNRFPALRRDAVVSRGSRDIYKVEPAYGASYVVVETPEHEGDLDTVLFTSLVKYIGELKTVTARECSDERIKHVLPFRNKGEVIGVSLTHPHSQIYVFPFIPPRIERELVMLKEYREQQGGCLLCRIMELERDEKTRLLYENNGFLVFLPFYAMWPYEVHIVSKRHIPSLLELTDSEVEDLADSLKVVVAGYNSLFDFSLPYMMAIHQAPCRGERELFHLHVEFYPVHRARDKLKYAAGVEWGGWVFTYDGLPEERALELREAFKKGLEKLETSPEGYKARGRVHEG
ncbi:MAG: galactose-1-phosphate uridylyltransferase [Desulfurococcus sp.]|nr:galactose-1-phosphate uridylyltransferase [Desulfurococcus sp.]